MTYIGNNFRRFLNDDSSIKAKVDSRIYEDHIPQTANLPFIWLRKRQGLSLDLLAPDAGMEAKDFAFDVECVAVNQPQAKQLAELFIARCNFYRGSFGDLTAQGVFVSDQDADYEPKSVGSDTGFFVEAADVRVVVA